MCPSVFVVDFEEVSAGWEAKEGLDYKKEVDSSAGATWSLNNGSVKPLPPPHPPATPHLKTYFIRAFPESLPAFKLQPLLK